MSVSGPLEQRFRVWGRGSGSGAEVQGLGQRFRVWGREPADGFKPSSE